jgi:hypothetical protein
MSVPHLFGTAQNRTVDSVPCSEPLVKEWRNTYQAEVASLKATLPHAACFAGGSERQNRARPATGNSEKQWEGGSLSSLMSAPLGVLNVCGDAIAFCSRCLLAVVTAVVTFAAALRFRLEHGQCLAHRIAANRISTEPNAPAHRMISPMSAIECNNSSSSNELCRCFCECPRNCPRGCR